MYSTCMFCNHSLGENQIVEHFPIGRRLAFDSDKGRLWVVCKRCERWNLSPIEERWEAIEDCERLYYGIRTRASSENIGLARHREGAELVRIGIPLRPEFAAWRYGDQFGRRRKKAILLGVGATAVVGTIAFAGVATGVLSGALVGLCCVFIRAPRFSALGPGVDVLAWVDGEPVLVRQGAILASSFHPGRTDDPRVHELLLRPATDTRS